MSVHLSSRAESLIQKKVESGLYPSADAVIEEALRLLEEHDRLRWLREAVAKGQEGEGIPYTPGLRAEMWQNALRRAKAGEQPSSDVLPPDDDTP